MSSALLNELYSENGLAEYLSKAKSTLKRWRATGDGPPVTRIGRSVYYAKDDVKEWLRSQSQRAGGRRAAAR